MWFGGHQTFGLQTGHFTKQNKPYWIVMSTKTFISFFFFPAIWFFYHLFLLFPASGQSFISIVLVSILTSGPSNTLCMLKKTEWIQSQILVAALAKHNDTIAPNCYEKLWMWVFMHLTNIRIARSDQVGSISLEPDPDFPFVNWIMTEIVQCSPLASLVHRSVGISSPIWANHRYPIRISCK